MLVKFSTKNATVYDRDRAAMEKKLGQRLSRYFAAAEDVEAFVKVSEEKLGFKVEITLPYYGYQLRAEAGSKEGLFAAFDDAVDTLERRMTRHKGKVQGKKGAKPAEPEPEEIQADEEFELVRVKKYELKPMSVQDAILNMELLGHDFYVFKDSDENKVCTVYKRKDGGYGVVVPE